MTLSRFNKVIGAAVLVGSLSFGALAPAAYASSAATSFTCSKLTGTLNLTTGAGTLKYSGCTGNTGKKSKTVTVATTSPTVITWANGKSTSLSVATLTPGTKCPVGTAADDVASSKVTADTTGSTTVGHAAKSEVCITATSATTATLSLAPKTKATF